MSCPPLQYLEKRASLPQTNAKLSSVCGEMAESEGYIDMCGKKPLQNTGLGGVSPNHTRKDNEMYIEVRNVNEQVVNMLENQARLEGITLDEYLRRCLSKVANAQTEVHGIIAYAPSGDTVTIKDFRGQMTASYRELPRSEWTVVQKAQFMCSPLNGSRWADARKLLENAGFEVFFQ
jgi:hypothetical protein